MNPPQSTPAQHAIGAALVVLVAAAAVGWTAYKNSDRLFTAVVTPEELNQFFSLYRAYNTQNGRSPSSLDELAEFDEESGYEEPENVYELIRRGHVQVVWNAEFFDEPALDHNFVLAWETIAPTRGGFVVLGDGELESVTTVEFEAMSKLPAKEQPATE